MSTYAADDAEHLLLAGRSMIEQTLLPDEIVLVCDGVLTEDLLAALKTLEIEARAKGIVWKQVDLPENRGLARALNAGIAELTSDWVARMDADDYALPQRLEKQVNYLKNNPDTEVLFTAQAEFYTSHETVDALKVVPTEHDDIVSLLRWRNIISHPTVVYSRKRLFEAGGYRAVPYLEDYDLYMRMLEKGATFGALEEPMVHVRVSPQQVRRRGGLRYAFVEVGFRFNLMRKGMLKFHQWLISTPLYFCFRIAPPFLKWKLYRTVRKNPQAV